jgi:hypothetical protein
VPLDAFLLFIFNYGAGVYLGDVNTGNVLLSLLYATSLSLLSFEASLIYYYGATELWPGYVTP